MNYIQTTINVSDIDKSKEFYNKLIGLDIVREFHLGDKHLVFLGKDSTCVELIYDGNTYTNPEHMNISMGFSCEDLDEAINIMSSNGYEPITDIINVNENLRFIYIKDPDGFKIQLVEHR